MTGISAGAAAGRAGSSFLANGNLAAGATTIVAPSSNVNGIYLRSVILVTAAGQTAVIATGAAAPTGIATNQALVVSQNAQQQQTVRDVFVPPGQGIYHYNAAAGSSLFVGYDIL